MNEEPTVIDCDERRRAWLRRLAEEFLKLEPLFPAMNFLPAENLPPWVRNVEREVGAALLPVAKIKEELNLTPRHMGALLGHSCALGVWMMEDLAHELAKAKTKANQNVDLPKHTPEELEQGVKFLRRIVSEWYPALCRLAKRALYSCVDQTYEDMTGFLVAYSAAFARKPQKLGMADIGSPTIEMYFCLLNHWRLVEQLGSVRALHEWLVKLFGPYRTGELKRVEKICQRIGLHYRKPGRPKKVK